LWYLTQIIWNLSSKNWPIRWGLPPLYILFLRVLSIRCETWVFLNTPPSRLALFGLGVWIGLGGLWIWQALIPCWNFKMVSEPLQDLLGHLLSGFRYPVTTIYVNEPSPIVLVVRGCVKSPTLDMTWPDNMFISGDNPHLTSRFCKDELDSKFQHFYFKKLLRSFIDQPT